MNEATARATAAVGIGLVTARTVEILEAAASLALWFCDESLFQSALGVTRLLNRFVREAQDNPTRSISGEHEADLVEAITVLTERVKAFRLAAQTTSH